MATIMSTKVMKKGVLWLQLGGAHSCVTRKTEFLTAILTDSF